MGPIQTFRELLGMLRRRFVLIAVVLFAGLAGSFYYAMQQPHTYESAAVLQVDSPVVMGEAPAGGATTAQRLQLIQQRLMVRENLLGIIERHRLFTDLEGQTEAEKAQLLAASTRIESISAVQHGYSNDGRVAALIITVGLDDPDKAAAVANEFAAAVVEQDSRARTQQAREALSFFEAEERRISDQMIAIEAEISEFKNRNEDALPDGLTFRRDELSRLWENNLSIDQRILELERELAALESDSTLRLGAPGTADPLEEELRQLEVQLAEARRIFAAGHPEILRLQTRIEAVTSGSGEASLAAAERQRLMVLSQIAALRAQKELVGGRRQAIEAALSRMPEVEMQLNTLERKLAQIQDQYSVVNRRLSEAETTLKLESGQQTERFAILEPARPPDHPASSGRKKIMVFGAAGSAGAAFGLAFLLEILNPVMRSATQMERMLGLRPVVSIPPIVTLAERRRRRLVNLAVLIALLLMGGLAALWVVDATRPATDLARLERQGG